MRVHTETRSLPTELTPEDLAKESQALAAAVERVTEQEENIAEQKALWAEKKKGLEGYLSHLKTEMNELATIVDSGIAPRDVPCSWLYALKLGYAFMIRDDTGELVTHRRLTDAERQDDLLEVVREPKAEQVEGWTATLGLVIDPQADLPLAAPDAGGDPVFYYRDFHFQGGGHGAEKVTMRFTEADHRPSSLAGVYVHPDSAPETGLPEMVDKGTYAYDTAPEAILAYRAALEEIQEGKRQEVMAADRASGHGALEGGEMPDTGKRQRKAAR